MEFSVFLYPGEQLLVLANHQVLLDTVGSPTKNLSYINLPIRKEGLSRLRFLTMFRQRVYLDTTLTTVQNLGLVGFSKPFFLQEAQARPEAEVLSLPPIDSATRTFRAIAEPIIRY
jgi:hypothetical protein